jgi:fatty acid desaturase
MTTEFENYDGFEYASEDQNFRKSISNAVGNERLKTLRSVKLYKTVVDIVIIFILFFLAFTILFFLSRDKINLFAILFGSFLAGIGFNWLNVQVHEGSHFLLARNKNLNDFIATYIVGSFGFQSVKEYRRSHFVHHAHLNEDIDPDKYFYQEIIISRMVFAKFLFTTFLGGAVLHKITRGNWVPGSEENSKEQPHVLPKLVGFLTHSFITYIIQLNYGTTLALSYVLVFSIGLGSFFPVLLAIRTWVQHKDPRTSFEVTTERVKSKPPFVSRTTVTNIFERLCIGARMDYHFEHHLFSRIPHYNLKKLHNELVEIGFFEESIFTNLVTDDFTRFAFDIAKVKN